MNKSPNQYYKDFKMSTGSEISFKEWLNHQKTLNATNGFLNAEGGETEGETQFLANKFRLDMVSLGIGIGIGITACCVWFKMKNK